MLNKVEFGSGGVPLLIVHGLFGSARNWGVIAKRLAQDRRVITVDMRNHGSSFRDDDNSYFAMANDLDLIASEHEEIDILGHSMGGKAAMVAALTGTSFRRIVVADIAPVAYNHSQGHLVDAMATLDLPAIAKRQEADEALSETVADRQVRAFLLQSLIIKEKRWMLNLPVLYQEMDKITGWPKIAGTFDNPVLFLSGGSSDYVQASHRPTIKSYFPKARFAKIPKAGHWLHAEQPRPFEETVRIFLDA